MHSFVSNKNIHNKRFEQIQISNSRGNHIKFEIPISSVICCQQGNCTSSDNSYFSQTILLIKCLITPWVQRLTLAFKNNFNPY